jgi:hypothetical protein
LAERHSLERAHGLALSIRDRGFNDISDSLLRAVAVRQTAENLIAYISALRIAGQTADAEELIEITVGCQSIEYIVAMIERLSGSILGWREPKETRQILTTFADTHSGADVTELAEALIAAYYHPEAKWLLKYAARNPSGAGH